MPQARIQNDAYIEKIRALFQLKYQRDLEFAAAGEGVDDAFFVRAVNYHQCMVPWIETVFPLKGTSVVEIGGGAGAATLAVAQKCAQIDSYDIDKASLDLGAYRAGFTGCENVRLHLMPPDWALPQRIAESKVLFPQECDVILLPAILEHMKLEERLSVLEMLWSILRPGGIMVVYDTPNRLYGYDMHSFRLPFFNWLPDDLALLYASRSSRAAFPALLAQSAAPSGNAVSAGARRQLSRIRPGNRAIGIRGDPGRLFKPAEASRHQRFF
jgi:2-polyprenyl-3-methyl-5-hydroxy-6-metoxy-1,4-benzoquinol methylase